MLAVYGYHAYNHYERDDSMYIHRPDKELSLAENFLRMLRPDMKYTPLETHVLDIALLLHMVVVIIHHLQQELLLPQVQIHTQQLQQLCHHLREESMVVLILWL